MHATPTGPDATLGCRPRVALKLPPSTGHPNRTGKIPSGLPAGPSKKLATFFSSGLSLATGPKKLIIKKKIGAKK